MKWQDVARLLKGTIPKEQSTPILQVEPLSESLKTYMKWADKFLTNTTEIEANARVLLLVLDAVSQCNDVIINLQPSVDVNCYQFLGVFMITSFPLPSPSEMKWQDVRHILDGTIPK